MLITKISKTNENCYITFTLSYLLYKLEHIDCKLQIMKNTNVHYKFLISIMVYVYHYFHG